jgi:hypothetical protein
MKPTSGDEENESRETQWPSVPKIASADEFWQSVAVAELAVKLCELQKRELQNKWDAEDKKYARDMQTAVKEAEKQRVNEERKKQVESRIATLDPEHFVARASQLIEKAREHVLRPQTDVEYLLENNGTEEAVARVIGRRHRSSRIPFEQLCNANCNKGDTGTIRVDTLSPEGKKDAICMDWKVYKTEKGFDDLFWRYWHDIAEKWKNPKHAEEQGKLRFDGNSVQMYSKEERHHLAKLACDTDAWKESGKQLLADWKRNGVPPNDFLALAKFRRERDKRSANLKRSSKRKRRLQAVKHQEH